MKYNHDTMCEILSRLLIPGETLRFPVYAGFPETGFFARAGSLQTGFASLTSMGRLIYARYNVFGQCTGGFFNPSLAQKVAVKKNIFGQYVIDCRYLVNGKKQKIRIQIAPKVVGCKFPEQQENSESLTRELSGYEQ